jgi:hypothetical protein
MSLCGPTANFCADAITVRLSENKGPHLLDASISARDPEPTLCARRSFEGSGVCDERRLSVPRMRDRVLAEAREVVVDLQPRQFGAYTLMECRTHTGGLI